MAISGVGRLGFRTKRLTPTAIAQEIMMAPVPIDFQLNAEDEDAREVRGWKLGKRQIVATLPGDQRDRLVISFEFFDWYHLQFARDELAQNVNRIIPVFKEGRVPTSAPYRIEDPDISASNAGDIVASVVERGTWGEAGFLNRVDAAPTGRQFRPVVADTELIFPASLSGAAINYLIDVQYNSIPSIGVAANPVRFGTLEFIGQGYGPEYPNGVLIHIPQLGRRSRPNLSTADDIPTLEFEFDCQVAPGEREAVHYYLPPAA